MTRPTPGSGSAAAAPPACYRHPDRPTYISCVRCGRPICPEDMRPASVGFQCPEEDNAPPVRTVTGGLAGSDRARALFRIAPVTMSLIAANVLVFVIFVLGGSGLLGSAIGSSEAHAVQASLLVADGQWYRIVTAMFAHFGLIHIGSNMLVLFFIGIPLERQIGRVRFAAVYFLGGIGGGVATYLFANPLQVSAGASGAIFALLGAYGVVARRLPNAQLGSVTGTIVLNLVITFSIPGISITDHIGGLVVGAILGALLALDGRLPARAAARARALTVEAGGFVLVLVVVGALFAVRTHELRGRYQLGVTPISSSASSASLHDATRPARLAGSSSPVDVGGTTGSSGVASVPAEPATVASASPPARD